MNKTLKIVVVLCGISIAVNAWFLFRGEKNSTQESARNFPYLSPRIFAEQQNDILINFLPLRKSLRTLVEGYGDSFNVYFEYLPTGTSIGVREKDEFQAASLIKVPVVMAYFHQMERQGFAVDSTVTLEEKDIDKTSGDLWTTGVGSRHTFNEVVKKALVDSDNTAAMMLINRVSEDDFDEVYAGLDIEMKKEEKQVIISAKQYSSILKSLYFSSLLSKINSQYILDLLTTTKFTDKLPAGVPNSVRVAHKIGILKDERYQDCGIVYVPKRPYIVCMISKSNDALATIRMQAVSRLIYEYVSSYDKKGN